LATTPAPTPGNDHGQALDDDRVHLAGHDARARLGLGQRQLADPGSGAHAHQAHIRGDLPQAQRDRAQGAMGGDDRVEGGLGMEVIVGLADR
jgi:hypothetical protein